MTSDGAMDVLRAVADAARADLAMPAGSYTSAAYYQLERKRLFQSTWVLAGCGQEIPNPGDVMPSEVAGYPILLVRKPNGDVGAFFNVCPHRGAELIAKPCSGRQVLTCPYHAWTYDLDGRLRTRPYYNGGKEHDVADHTSGKAYPALTTIRAAMWADLVFVNIDGKAPPLDEHLNPAIEYFDGYDFSVMRLAQTLSFDVQANWKLPIENFYDNYHIFSLHPVVDAGLSQEHRTPSEWLGGPFIKGGYRVDGPASDWISGIGRNPNVCERLKNYNSFVAIAPNVMMQVWEFTVVVFQIVPVTENRTRERIHLYYYGDCATSDDHRSVRERIAQNWNDINQNEDIYIIEKMQVARSVPTFGSGELAPYWDRATVAFTKIMAGMMNADA